MATTHVRIKIFDLLKLQILRFKIEKKERKKITIPETLSHIIKNFEENKAEGKFNEK